MLLKNGFLINPKTHTQELTDIRILDGKISQISAGLVPENSEEVLDLTGLTVAPGLVDTHIHFRDPGLTYKEDLHTGALAAAKGGVTSVICMANTKPAVDSVETLTDILTRAKKKKLTFIRQLLYPKGLREKS